MNELQADGHEAGWKERAPAEPLAVEDTAGGPVPVVFVIMQSGNRANGGVESITQVVERLRGARPWIVTNLRTPVNERWRRAGAHVEVWPLPYRKGSPWEGDSAGGRVRRTLSLLDTNRRVASLVRRTGARVVHCNDIHAWMHSGVGARMAGARCVFNVRDTKDGAESYGLRWRAAYRLSDSVLVLSEEMRDFLRRELDPGKSGRREKIRYVYSVVDLERMRPAKESERPALRRSLGIDEDEVAIGYVATFNPKKAQLPFIEQALPRLAEEVPNARLYFLGDFDPERNPYARACSDAVEHRELGGNVRFVGFSSDIVGWYRALDLVVLASRKEGLARSMIEALACGTPVVSFDVCSAREILEGGDCGRVVPQGEYAALSDRLGELARSPGTRRILGERGERLARRLFDPEHVVRSYEDLYRRLHFERSGGGAA